eukprot:TRINITY_DN25008_c0_g2_i3.p1 TRINITY_DN25008_c0_g2~~TRINITY_DN25008_c0_g2_i3.p1  ORF type:complete len:760 (-),score=106.84 TRINITY_DN25008_c0_g2_i3:75-2354(-)
MATVSEISAGDGVSEAVPSSEPTSPSSMSCGTSDGASNGVKAMKRTSDADFRAMMERRRSSFETSGSKIMTDSVCTAAAASSGGVRTENGWRGGRDSVSTYAVPSPPPFGGGYLPRPDNCKLSVKETGDLQDWMARMRGRCNVLESTPTETTADAWSETISAPSSLGDEGRPSSAGSGGGVTAASNAVRAGRPVPQQCSTMSERGALRAGLLQGPFTHAEREQQWPLLLADEKTAWSASSTNGKVHKLCEDASGKIDMHFHIPPALLELLSDTALQSAEKVLFDANANYGGKVSARDVSTAQRRVELAMRFSRKHLAWLRPHGVAGEGESEEEDWGAPNRRAFLALAQLLRYHSPSTSARFDSICKVAGRELHETFASLCNSCGMAVGLNELLFELPEDEVRGPTTWRLKVQALLTLCDAVVVEGDDIVLLFIIVVLLTEISVGDDCTYAQLEGKLREALTFQGLGTRNSAEVCCCVAEAKGLLNATPVSLRGALAQKGRPGARLDVPVCTVAPEEVLHHTHKGSPGGWRLIVVDVRMRMSTIQLPVCYMLPRAQHVQRRRMLRELIAEDDSVHLCLVGDGPPMAGDDALELCRFLAGGGGGLRRHVSVVEGGWPAVEELACSLGLDLMPVDSSDERAHHQAAAVKVAVVAEKLTVAKQAATEAAAEKVAGAKHAASAMGKGVQQAWSGAGRYFSSFLDYADGLGGGALGDEAAGVPGEQRGAQKDEQRRRPKQKKPTEEMLAPSSLPYQGKGPTFRGD